jgi:hypothetical protein
VPRFHTLRRRRNPLLALTATLVALAIGFSTLGKGAPARPTTHISAAALCGQGVVTVEAALNDNQSHAAGPVEEAAVTLHRKETATLAAHHGEILADCEHTVEQANWSYLPARLVEIAIDSVITVAVSTAICALTGPVGCTWGVRFGAFTGGFVGAIVFQYLSYGTVNWASVGSAFFDAIVSMLTFSGLDKLQESYVEKGVKDTFINLGTYIRSIATRVGGLGSGFIEYMQSFANFMDNRTLGMFPSSYGGGAGFEAASVARPAGACCGSGAILQFRADYAADYTYPVHDDLWSGSWNTPYYNWRVTRTGTSNGDGAIGYALSQNNNCLTDTGYFVTLTPCSANPDQTWYMDGDELMSYAGNCLDEWAYAHYRVTNSCTALSAQDNVAADDDEFVPTPLGTDFIPDTVSNWQRHLSTYEHA